MLNLIEASEFFLRKNEGILLDARSPKEHRHSRLKNSLNFFALSDAEHELIGTKYARNQFIAKCEGAALICANMSKHLKYFSKNFSPYKDEIFIYCARGGQRSGAIAQILSEIGFCVNKCKGGHKALRQFAIDFFANFSYENFFVLAGNTGCGKTRLLKNLPQKIDLEALAQHFGSTFGSRGFAQPSQQQFDFDLLEIWHKMDQNSPIFIEAESKNIGKITLSNAFYESMQKSTFILCEASIDTRVANCVADYQAISREFFYESLKRLERYLGKAKSAQLAQHYEGKNYSDVARILLLDYYDKVYKKAGKIDFVLNLDDLEKAKNELLEFANSTAKKN